MDVDGDRASVAIVGGNNSHLVGKDGEALDALQELTRLAVYRETGQRSRLMLDIDGYRIGRRTAATDAARGAIESVQSNGVPVELAPMNAFERKVVHDVVAESGLVSGSKGEGVNRHVVISQGSADDSE
ncbi:MAG: single-stranded DNA-binding protein [Aeromicrobium sp.]|nr:MAG: single-stranded DNA-binding protein [Aeromicrobium sp.]